MRPAGLLSARPSAERFIRTLKEQLLRGRTFATAEELRQSLPEWAHRHNEPWLQECHNDISPSNARRELKLKQAA